MILDLELQMFFFYFRNMNVDKLIHRYFKGNQLSPTIEVFDNDTIYSTYTDIVNLLNGYLILN